MKKQVMFCLGVLLLFLMTSGVSYAGGLNFQVEPYVTGGSIGWVENGVREGNKFTLGVGIKSQTYHDDLKNLKATVKLEGWQMGEGLDEDTEIPTKSHSADLELRYDLKIQDVIVYPYATIGYNWMKRNGGGNQVFEGSWDRLKYADWQAGIGGQYKIVSARVGLYTPFAIKANHHNDLRSKIGYNAEVDVNVWKQLVIGVFYKQLRFGGTHNTPGAQANLTGLRIGWQL